ncbi:MAG: FecR domain-containing protein [Rhizomicrobium sp.]
MSDEGEIPDIDSVRLAEAAAWRMHLAEIDAETTADFEAWLTEPGCTEAWARVAPCWDYFGEQASAPELVRARQAALGDARRASAQRRSPREWRSLIGGIAAVLVLGMIAWGAVRWLQSPDDYATAFGERRVLTLADGSRVSLDSNSEVTVRYSKNARELQLLRGQARFDVAHDVERPFSVLAGEQKVIATGTAFNIDVGGSKVVVTLIEGHVVVLDENRMADPTVASAAPSPRRRSIELKAGQQLAALPEKPPEIARANIQRVTAWTTGQLMFDNEPLSAVVARINRYTGTPIVIDDPKVAALRISGVFNTGDINGFVDVVTHYLPVQAVSEDGGKIALKTKE